MSLSPSKSGGNAKMAALQGDRKPSSKGQNKKAKVLPRREPMLQPLMRTDSRAPTGEAWYQHMTLADKVEGVPSLLLALLAGVPP